MTSTPMPTRGQRMPRSERRAQLLDAAQAVFVQSGYHAAAMDEIADRAGVSKPVLYQHFPGKLDLYLALLDKHCDTLESLVRAALEVGGDNEVRVERTVAAYFQFVTSASAAFRMVFESDLTSVPQVRARLDAVEMNCAEAIAEAHRNTTRAEWVVAARLRASMTRTPVMRFDFASCTSPCTIASVTIVRRPVARAAGSVAERLEK